MGFPRGRLWRQISLRSPQRGCGHKHRLGPTTDYRLILHLPLLVHAADGQRIALKAQLSEVMHHAEGRLECGDFAEPVQDRPATAGDN